MTNKYKCPLCDSALQQNKYLEIVGVWEEKKKFEQEQKKLMENLKKEEHKLKKEKADLLLKQKKDLAKTQKDFLEKGKEHEKKRTSRLIHYKTTELNKALARVKSLETQLKNGNTPQTDGLNFESELVKELKKMFPSDDIQHKGKGGDILHNINFKGKKIGSVLYECKKTQDFKPKYVNQIKEDMAKRNSTYGVLVTSAFQKGKSGFWIEKGILIVHPYGTVHIAGFLREQLIEIHSLKLSEEERKLSMNKLFQYIKSDDFKNTIENTIHSSRELYSILQKEIKSHKTLWINRNKYLNKISNNMISVKQSCNIFNSPEKSKQELVIPKMKVK